MNEENMEMVTKELILYTKWFTMRLPLKESFYVRGTEEGRHAEHEMWIFGLKFLHIEYDIKKVAIKQAVT